MAQLHVPVGATGSRSIGGRRIADRGHRRTNASRSAQVRIRQHGTAKIGRRESALMILNGSGVMILEEMAGGLAAYAQATSSGRPGTHIEHKSCIRLLDVVYQ
jgi:hypothetical protein